MKFEKAGQDLFTRRIQDARSKAHRQGAPVLTSFLSSSQQDLAAKLLGNQEEAHFWGGYEEAEKKQLCIHPQSEPEFDIVCLHTGTAVAHPKLLGAIMHLGIEREQIGDILCAESDTFVFCRQAMAPFLISECRKAGGISFVLEYCGTDDLPAARKETIKVITSSLRLDGVVAALAGCSRSQAMEKIRTKDVKINDALVAQNQKLWENDVVSIRRSGRFKFLGVQGSTRKERLVLVFEKSV